MRLLSKFLLFLSISLGVAGLLLLSPVRMSVIAQQPTGSLATVTGTPSGPYITVNNPEGYINVRAGPSTYMYPELTILYQGQTAPALGRTVGGEWIQIYVPGVPGDVGWVYAPMVSLSPGSLSFVDPPPTATPRTTPTIDPTLAAAFAIPLTPTRLPTFTPAPPVIIPTYTPAPVGIAGVPMGMIIAALALIGIFGAIVSFLRGR